MNFSSKLADPTGVVAHMLIQHLGGRPEGWSHTEDQSSLPSDI